MPRSFLRAACSGALVLAVFGHPLLMSGAMPCAMPMAGHSMMVPMDGRPPAAPDDRHPAPADHGPHDCCMCAGACGVALTGGRDARDLAILLAQSASTGSTPAVSQPTPFTLPRFVLPVALAPPVRA
jgi:hypothetical protein